MRSDGALIQWQLAMVAPGAYRWRDLSWSDRDVNVVVGIRCDSGEQPVGQPCRAGLGLARHGQGVGHVLYCSAFQA
jgi:hypothetical protein